VECAVRRCGDFQIAGARASVHDGIDTPSKLSGIDIRPFAGRWRLQPSAPPQGLRDRSSLATRSSRHRRSPDPQTAGELHEIRTSGLIPTIRLAGVVEDMGHGDPARAGPRERLGWRIR